MRAFLFSIAVASLAACGQPQSTVPQTPPQQGDTMDPVELEIAIGRYGAMQSQVEGLTEEVGSIADLPDEFAQRRDLARKLREEVWRYNFQRSHLCAEGYLTASTCGAAFAPVWLDEPADAEITHETLVERAIEVGGVVMPLWNAVCEDAGSRVPEAERMSVCPME
ncbi:MAG: hypothetical protein WDM79_14135 [Terricaulis sp.]